MIRPALLSLSILALSFACSDTGGDNTPTREPAALGAGCRADADCIAGVCLESEYGTSFCTRACETPWEPCIGGPDVAEGQALCVSFETLPNAESPRFKGDLQQFCAPRCSGRADCTAIDAAWEVCDVPKYLGDPLFPALGSIRVCQSPSYHGKEIVDPSACDWEKTIPSGFQNEANLCRSYCEYLDRCKELPPLADTRCCEWGCFNQLVDTDKQVVDSWADAVRCYLDTHRAFPDSGTTNSCNQPPRECGGTPVDPTPAIAKPSTDEAN
ncbi:MAG: hypothetical protein ACI9MR_003700 [Myxococcota bacterium]|jgi:hypothetical protein